MDTTKKYNVLIDISVLRFKIAQKLLSNFSWKQHGDQYITLAPCDVETILDFLSELNKYDIKIYKLVSGKVYYDIIITERPK